ncbi:WW domain containing E3 ubiquitin protein ligase 1 [Cichlidogyrus casuarinus]|uniref:HECT-type E3 ubiquitin transferase n=1 Tax=Cichlidogyrus casuarinus TaxID=1844966 RepID=A0ABD2QIV7_9PLAT
MPDSQTTPQRKDPKNMPTSFHPTPSRHAHTEYFTSYRTFKSKVYELRQLRESKLEDGVVRISVGRPSLLNDSIDQIMKLEPSVLRKKLRIDFKNEEALDHDGVSREWFYKVSMRLLNPDYGLFQYASKTNFSLQINRISAHHPDPEHIKFYRFAGRFIALALFNGNIICSNLTTCFYKQLLNRKITIDDIEKMDTYYFNSLKSIE